MAAPNILKGPRNSRLVHGTRRTRTARKSSLREERSWFPTTLESAIWQTRLSIHAARSEKTRPRLRLTRKPPLRGGHSPQFAISNFRRVLYSLYYFFTYLYRISNLADRFINNGTTSYSNMIKINTYLFLPCNTNLIRTSFKKKLIPGEALSILF